MGEAHINQYKGLFKSLNVNGWNHKLSGMNYEDRLNAILDLVADEWYNDIKAPVYVVALQEICVGKHSKYLKQIEQTLTDFQLILPYNFDESHYKSVINVLLVRKEIVKEIEVFSLVPDELYMYNYILVHTVFGQRLRFLNLHMPQLAVFDGRPQWYVQSRFALSNKLWASVLEEVDKYHNNQYFFVLGDMNASFSDSNMVKLQFGYNMVNITEKKNTYFNDERGIKSQLDYIFLSLPTIANRSNDIKSALVDLTSYDRKLSDHSILKTCITIPEIVA